jgi:uncharacterized Zn-binding protein involved in type VI secretion
MPVVARRTDLCFCPVHLGGIIEDPGEPTVLVCFQPVVRKGDKVCCLGGVEATIIEGDESILVGGKPVARKGDHTDHGGVILTGCPRVRLGLTRPMRCNSYGAKLGTPFIRYARKGRAMPIKAMARVVED